MDTTNEIRILCRKLVIIKNEAGIQWLIGSPFFPPFTVSSTFRCIHTLPSDPLSPDFSRESDDLRTLLLKGFEIIGALIVGAKNTDFQGIASEAIVASRKLRKTLSGSSTSLDDNRGLIGAVVDPSTGDVQFFVSCSRNSGGLESANSVVYDGDPDKYVWERGCLLKCELPIRLPVYYPANSPKDLEGSFTRATEAVAATFRDSKATYILETDDESSIEVPQPVILRGIELDCQDGTPQVSSGKQLSCAYFCLSDKDRSSFTSVENADIIQASVMLSRSETSLKPLAPVAEYFPATDEANLLVVNYKLDVICYAAKDIPLVYAVSKLVIPGLVDQFRAMKKMILPNLLQKHPQLHPYHFNPPGFLHPVTSIYELSYGETEMKQGDLSWWHDGQNKAYSTYHLCKTLRRSSLTSWQFLPAVEVRRSLHLRLGLPFDRPLLRIASALKFSIAKDSRSSKSIKRGAPMLKDVHIGIPSSGVSGGVVSLIQGSYDYYHYLQDGLDDSGWGCAYRSLQTIVSWFKLQHYTSIDVPSHREIQQSLVEIGDKDQSFIGSREWIGAIELSFVLDKLLGVSCKVINVRSGDELPEKCRELAVHFESQGTPIMIGGGVLAYTLLGVDYNESSGDCAFLILDPHYTGTDDLKKIVNGGWCGWKKAVDSKGKHFFLHNKFYNLLLPQRPNMV